MINLVLAKPYSTLRAVPLTVLFTLALVPDVTCYRPSIADGGLACAAGDLCPAGYTCRLGHCWTHATGPDVGTTPDVDAADTTQREDTPPDVPAKDSGPCPTPTTFGCSPATAFIGPCDPVCQSGSCDWCTQKCTIAGDGTTVCATSGPQSSGMSCTVSNLGLPSQRDNCQVGAICLFPDVGTALSFCFSMCRSSAECPGAVACAPRQVAPASTGAAVQTDVCDPPYARCDPLSPTACCDPIALTGCPDGRFCYLVSPDTGTQDSRTVCEYTTGGIVRDSCRSSRDCMPNYGCSPVGFCQRVCNDANPCPVGSCSHVGSGTEYGYCPP